ncbi:hypothetical protein JKP88DRAFT_273988 [Tribonema minus]|uniref:Uncharacterized protein n=1 Tax=Tribonema minus TaxID=303371 RepID=A0A836C9N7_9STRA|nr:hypothetical protein JKP88DRAFT_273988 [Tribonema minus]
MARAIRTPPISAYEALLLYACIGQPHFGLPFIATLNMSAADRPDTERWKARAVLQREYHDVFQARNPLLYAAFITEPGQYTAEALQHYLRETGAKTAVVVVGVAHQGAVESHLCGTQGYAMQLLDVDEQLPAAKRVVVQGPGGSMPRA